MSQHSKVTVAQLQSYLSQLDPGYEVFHSAADVTPNSDVRFISLDAVLSATKLAADSFAARIAKLEYTN